MVFFEKTFPAPKSLNTHTTYSNQDVLDMLYEDFHNKCYICESKGIESINIEHFAPHLSGKYIYRKFSWSNLFWACSHCNKIKSATEPLLNCTDIEDKVDSNIKYFLDDNLEDNKVVIESIAKDQKTLNTVQLLIDVYNGTSLQNKFQAREKRNKLYDELSDFSSFTLKYLRTEDKKKKKQLFNTIVNELSNQSIFTAFKRWFIKDNKNLIKDFKKYIED